jgi:hypothetical protein
MKESDMTETAPWDCEAYGPEGTKYGALCFRREVGRACATTGECHDLMESERERVWHRLRALRFTGDEFAAAMLVDIKGPADLLNGPGYPDGAPNG